MTLNIYDFSELTRNIDAGLRAIMSPGWAVFTEYLIIGLVFLIFYALLGLFLVYAERKVCAFIQNRLGTEQGRAPGYFSDHRRPHQTADEGTDSDKKCR